MQIFSNIRNIRNLDTNFYQYSYYPCEMLLEYLKIKTFLVKVLHNLSTFRLFTLLYKLKKELNT